jgi:hypothetical protein
LRVLAALMLDDKLDFKFFKMAAYIDDLLITPTLRFSPSSLIQLASSKFGFKLQESISD